MKGSVKFDSYGKRKTIFGGKANAEVPIQYEEVRNFAKRPIGFNNSPGLCPPTSRKLIKLKLFGEDEKSLLNTVSFKGITHRKI